MGLAGVSGGSGNRSKRLSLGQIFSARFLSGSRLGARFRCGLGVSGSGGPDDVTKLRIFPAVDSTEWFSRNAAIRVTNSSSFSISSSI